MAKLLAYLPTSQLPNHTLLFIQTNDTVVDNEYTSIANDGTLLDGTPVIFGRKYAVATLNSAGTGILSSSGTVTETGTIPVTNGKNYILETPAGTVDDSNLTFTLTNTPTAGSLIVYTNGGVLLSGTEYSLSTNTISLNTPIGTGGWILAMYF